MFDFVNCMVASRTQHGACSFGGTKSFGGLRKPLSQVTLKKLVERDIKGPFCKVCLQDGRGLVRADFKRWMARMTCTRSRAGGCGVEKASVVGGDQIWGVVARGAVNVSSDMTGGRYT